MSGTPKHRRLVADIGTGETVEILEDIIPNPEQDAREAAKLAAEASAVRTITEGVAAIGRLDATFRTILDSGRPTPAEVATTYLPAVAENWPKMTALLRLLIGRT